MPSMMVADWGAEVGLNLSEEMERMVPVEEEKVTVWGAFEKAWPLKRRTEWTIVSAMAGERRSDLATVFTMAWADESMLHL